MKWLRRRERSRNNRSYRVHVFFLSQAAGYASAQGWHFLTEESQKEEEERKGKGKEMVEKRESEKKER